MTHSFPANSHLSTDKRSSSHLIAESGNAPLVSIILAFYNAERYLAETLDSVLCQTLDDWELILVNDGSTDASATVARTIVDKHAKKVRLLTHEHGANRGVCASRNLGIEHARGQLLAFLDADDVWTPNKLEEQSALLLTNPDAAMIFGAPRYWNSWDNSRAGMNRDFTPSLGLEPDTLHRPPSLLYRCHPLGRASAPCPSDLMLWRSVASQVNGFEESFVGKFQMYEDQAFLGKVYLDYAVYASATTWTYYRLHEQSCCSSVTGAGDENEVRLFYLDWLTNYLQKKAVTNPRILKSLEKAYRLQESASRQWIQHKVDAFTSLFRQFRWW